MIHKEQGVVWWKVILGGVLAFVQIKQLLFPLSRALQPANAVQAASMKVTELLIFVGALWLLYSGLKNRNSN
jgi:hypothetical protein